MPSKLMKKDIRYSVYLPDGYHTSGQKYPVLYLLHGYTDEETVWIQFGNVRRIADEAIATGKIATGKSAEMIIVMPDAWIRGILILSITKSLTKICFLKNLFRL